MSDPSSAAGAPPDPANLYAAPAATLAEPPAAQQPPFYVVAPGKFLLLFFATLGLYQLYWSYLHWTRFRRRTGTPMWPVARAIFSIFFAHSLNREIDHRLRERVHAWSPGPLATFYVLASICSNVLDRLAARSIGSPHTDLASLAILLPIGLTLWKTQEAANAACDDPTGRGNAVLTWANYLWIAFGMLLWGLALYGIHLEAVGTAG